MRNKDFQCAYLIYMEDGTPLTFIYTTDSRHDVLNVLAEGVRSKLGINCDYVQTVHPILPNRWVVQAMLDDVDVATFEVKQVIDQGVTLHHAICTVTGEGMSEGWMVEGGELYLKNEKDADAYAREAYGKPLNQLDEDDLDIFYHTEFDDHPDSDEDYIRAIEWNGRTFVDREWDEYTPDFLKQLSNAN